MFLSQCNAQEIRAAFPGESEQPQYGATQFFFVFVFSCVQCFLVSVTHRTLTWTAGSLTCVRSYACVYARGWGTPTTSQHSILTIMQANNKKHFDSEKLSQFFKNCAPDGIRTSGHGILWISRLQLYQLSHHVKRMQVYNNKRSSSSISEYVFLVLSLIITWTRQNNVHIFGKFCLRQQSSLSNHTLKIRRGPKKSPTPCLDLGVGPRLAAVRGLQGSA